MMKVYLFYFLSLLLAISYIFVIRFRHTIHSAVALIFALIITGMCFGLIGVPFIAVTQILVYAGGVMVLFLFVIMMMSSGYDSKKKSGFRYFLGISSIVLFYLLSVYFIFFRSENMRYFSDVSIPLATRSLAFELFGAYLVPLELASIILFTACIGSVMILHSGDKFGVKGKKK